MEKVVYAPVQSLQNIILTPEDMQDLIYVQPFVLTSDDINEYDVQYLGREKVDEIGCYTFSVKPKKMVKGKRYFAGEIWVDDRDLQIVKTFGKGVGLRSRGSRDSVSIEEQVQHRRNHECRCDCADQNRDFK